VNASNRPASEGHEAAPRVSYQGTVGAFSRLGIAAIFDSWIGIEQRSVAKVFEAVEIGGSEFGVVPIENSHAGSINETYDLLTRHGVVIVGEGTVRIKHCLMALAGSDISTLTEVHSHPQALEQCREFLESLDVRLVAEWDTAGAAEIVAEQGREGVAAIASAKAAEIYGLEILRVGIEDRPDNSTKFVGIAKSPTTLLGEPNKTSIVFATADVPGALSRVLEEFAKRDLNLSKLESRPSRMKAWQYHFYLDFDAGASDEKAQEALSSLADHTSFLRVLGTYKSG
jgi:prephenate dehydratase